MATNFSQQYRYGGLVVEVQRLSEMTGGKCRFQCLVRGYGHGNPAPRKKYDVQAETNAQASRKALQLYNTEYGQEKH